MKEGAKRRPKRRLILIWPRRGTRSGQIRISQSAGRSGVTFVHPLTAEQVKADGSNLVFWPTAEAWRPDYWRSPNEATRFRTEGERRRTEVICSPNRRRRNGEQITGGRQAERKTRRDFPVGCLRRCAKGRTLEVLRAVVVLRLTQAGQRPAFWRAAQVLHH